MLVGHYGICHILRLVSHVSKSFVLISLDQVCASSASNGPSQNGDRGKRGREKKYITGEIKERDVLCCQGEEVNIKIFDEAWYYRIVERNRSSFDNATLAERKTIALKVANDEIVSEGGRFLKKDKNVNQWYLASDHAVIAKLSEDLQTKTYIKDEINSSDVLCGQGGKSNNHEGNIQYRRILDEHRPFYESASRKEKTATAQKVVKEIVSSGGHFLKKDQRVNRWYYADDILVWDKVTQALRDKSSKKKMKVE